MRSALWSRSLYNKCSFIWLLLDNTVAYFPAASNLNAQKNLKKTFDDEHFEELEFILLVNKEVLRHSNLLINRQFVFPFVVDAQKRETTRVSFFLDKFYILLSSLMCFPNSRQENDHGYFNQARVALIKKKNFLVPLGL